MKKPVRQPTPDEIGAFEETGRADRRLDPAQLQTETQKSVSPDLPPSGDTEPREAGKLQTRKAASTDCREHADPETSLSAKLETQEPENPPLQQSAKVEAQTPVTTETRKSANMETRISGPIVRLTIDLAEPDHTRFKTACAMTRRKMVDEVRTFIERRTAELEAEARRGQ
ncbi:hypothetical protein ASD50_19255 [Mesorhizobium sp. Root552]|jgi:hypothetical protein|uniref:hypothetical protein n=1 Tax=Mesorhizobium sp. Root552 TaxID=1736555 RepID=UPI0007021E41|nr:hypothetical protein [Mesorhizobium sp. Root552]KQZ28627.1 hypothetical protein ASD50_19255 [Mesorhizobium sp. Root552]